MAAVGLSKCGAPVAEHTSSTGTVSGVPGVTDNGQIVVEVVGAGAVVDTGAVGADVPGAVVPVPSVLDTVADPQPPMTAVLNRTAAVHRRTDTDGSDPARRAPAMLLEP
jgi:hypothetical protein